MSRHRSNTPSAIATAERRIVLTNDKDFGDLIFRDRLQHNGVILFRLGYVPLDVRMAHVERVLKDHADNLHALIVVSSRGIRVRQSRVEGSPEERATHQGGSSSWAAFADRRQHLTRLYGQWEPNSR